MPFKTILAAAAIAVLPALAHATDIAGDGSTNASLPVSGSYTNGTFERAGDRDWYRVYLKAGQDYAVSAYGGRSESADDNGSVSFALRGVDGRVLKTAWTGPETDGFSYRPAATGNYFLEAQDPAGTGGSYPVTYYIRATTDCAGSASTTCTLNVGAAPQHRLLTWNWDDDWMKVALVAGHRYTASLAIIPATQFKVLDPSRAVVAQLTSGNEQTNKLSFKALRTGTYYVRVTGDEGESPYTVGITSP